MKLGEKYSDNNSDESLSRLHLFWKISFPRENPKSESEREKHKRIVITIWQSVKLLHIVVYLISE